ncbi:hypothetical protein [Falsiroseomonas sp.]|uniref:hypothetical protein n=1 Tax=Falsiroseomonas sp. TaxID=2870721 RepID=UPI00356825DF
MPPTLPTPPEYDIPDLEELVGSLVPEDVDLPDLSVPELPDLPTIPDYGDLFG